MASLKKFEVMVRQNSDKTMDYLIVKYKRIMNDFQERPANKNEDGSYKLVWYAEIFDSRDNKTYKIFCDYATKLYDISNTYITQGNRIIKGVIYVSSFIDEIDKFKHMVPMVKMLVKDPIVEDINSHKSKNGVKDV